MVGANIANNAVTFLTTTVIAILVSTEEFGIYSVAVNVTMIAFAISEAGLGLSVVRHYSQETDETKKREILQAGVLLRSTLSFFLAMIALPMGLGLSYAISASHPISKELTIGVFSAAALGLWASARSTNQATQNYKAYAGLTVLYGLIRFCVITILYVTGVRDAIFFLGGLYLISPLLIAFWFYFAFNRQYGLWPAAINRNLLKSLLSYGRWVVVSYVLSPLCYTLPLFILMTLRGADVAGVYGVGLMFSAIVGPLSDALGAFVVPKVAAYSNSKEVHAYILRAIGFLGYFLTGLALAVIACSIVFQILFAAKYHHGLITMQILLAANLLASYGGMLNCVTHYLGMPYLNALANLGKIIIAGAGTWALAPELGAPGGAVAAASATILGEACLFIIIRRRLAKLSLS